MANDHLREGKYVDLLDAARARPLVMTRHGLQIHLGRLDAVVVRAK
jgi:hypothetical protein